MKKTHGFVCKVICDGEEFAKYFLAQMPLALRSAGVIVQNRWSATVF